MKELKAEDKCRECGEILREAELIENEECTTKGKKILACRCLHPGDFFCNCGNPCFSMF